MQVAVMYALRLTTPLHCCCCWSQVARRKGSDGKLLSMGFGFVETDSEAAAKAAIKALQVSRGCLLFACKWGSICTSLAARQLMQALVPALVTHDWRKSGW